MWLYGHLITQLRRCRGHLPHYVKINRLEFRFQSSSPARKATLRSELLDSYDWSSEVRHYSLVKPTTGQFTRFPIVRTGPPPGLINKPASLLTEISSPSVISFR
jgi:hypothetical protein